jgi:hypothetical protein
MQESLRAFCLQHRIHFEEEPQLLAPSRYAWHIKDILGKRWVVKSKDPEDATPELLKNFSVLHPPFHYPQPASGPEEAFLLYPYIPGRLLADDGFENPEVIEQVMEVIGRVQALMRSLVMVPFYQETLGLKDQGKDTLDSPPERLSFSRIQGTSEQQRAARHREMAESYHWTERKTQGCSDVLQSHGLWSQAPFEEFRERIHKHFALHLPMAGPNLSHTAVHPQHLLSCPDGPFGVLGWHIEPRPRFYMTYTYLAWSFLHSNKSDAMDFYRERLARNSNRAFHTEHHLVFAFCLVEQLAHWCGQKAGMAWEPAPQRIDEARELFIQCVENIRKEEEGSRY